jgi:hypothetical protein
MMNTTLIVTCQFPMGQPLVASLIDMIKYNTMIKQGEKESKNLDIKKTRSSGL